MPKIQEQFSAMSMEGRYGEAGTSKRQQFGVSPDERHLLSKWQNAGIGYQVRGTQSFLAMSME